MAAAAARPAAAAVQRKPPPAQVAREAPPEIERQVRELYAKFNPDKLPEVTGLLAKYRGRPARATAGAPFDQH